MNFVVTSQGLPIGTWTPDRLDHQFYYAWGAFTLMSAFERVRPTLATAPEGLLLHDLFGELFADMGEPDDDYDDYIAFCRARAALRLALQTPIGVVPGARIIGITREAGQDAWELLARADDAAAFEEVARIHYLHRPETFARFARPWTVQVSGEESPAHAARVQGAAQVLARAHKNNPLFIGPAAPTRERLVADTAGLLLAGGIEALAGWRVAKLDVDALLASEAWDETLLAVAWHAYQASPRTLFVIERFDRLMPWVTAVLKPLLARGQMRFIGTATLEDYREEIEKNASIQRRIQEIVAWGP